MTGEYVLTYQLVQQAEPVEVVEVAEVHSGIEASGGG